MIVLGIHTAGPACELALVSDGNLVAEVREEMMRGQDARLPDLVTELLHKADLSVDEVDRFAAVTGPGSFTGIRVGVAFGRGLALATGKPCLGVTTLEAALPHGQQGSAIVALPAQKRPPDITFWTQTFRTGMPTGGAVELTRDDLKSLLHEHPHIVFGDAGAIAPHLPGISVHATTPTAARAAVYAIDLIPEERPARPTYARQPDAALPKPRAQ